MTETAFIVCGIEQSEESRIYQFLAVTPAEATEGDVAVPGRFRFEQVLKPEWDLGDNQLYLKNGIAIDPYGCVTIPIDALTSLVSGEKHGSLTIIVSIQGENDNPFLGAIQLEDYTPLEGDPVLATKVGDMVKVTNEHNQGPGGLG